jgi:uncharacterized protein YPO0396
MTMSSDTSLTPPLGGIRLDRLEVQDWGTFDGPVWTLHTHGGNCLLTGDVGSGKSTLVDAMTMLLAPANKVTFNLAAGAATGERTLETYTLGQYRHLYDDATGSSRPDRLRSRSSVSRLLAVFTGPGGPVSAGVVLYFTDSAGPPQRLYVVADADLSIRDDMNGADLKAVRAALRSHGAELFDNFTAYQRALCRRLALKPTAFTLFAQTVSMKQVSDLTSFVRNHMLDAPDIGKRIEEMLRHYGDLTHSHDLVVDARRQVEALDQVATEASKYDSALEKSAAAIEAGTRLVDVVNSCRSKLLEQVIADANLRLPGLIDDGSANRESQDVLRDESTQIQIAIADAGGSDLTLAEQSETTADESLTNAITAKNEYLDLCLTAGIQPSDGPHDFDGFRRRLVETEEHHKQRFRDAQTLTNTKGSEAAATETALRELDEQLAAASTRPSNIPPKWVAARDRLADAMSLEPTDLPFAGELLKVDEQEKDWEGALERLTSGFARLLLVPHDRAGDASAWVDNHDSGIRLEYTPVPLTGAVASQPKAGTAAAKLVAREGHVMSGWVQAEVDGQFDHVCVSGPRDLHRHQRALTQAGQIKGGRRYIKDDSRPVGARHLYQLGWDTRARRVALADLRPELEEKSRAARASYQTANDALGVLVKAGYALQSLSTRFSSAHSIDVEGARERHERARTHLANLAARPEINELKLRLELVAEEISRVVTAGLELHRELVNLQERRDAADTELSGLLIDDSVIGDEALAMVNSARAQVADDPTNPAQCDTWQLKLSTKLAEKSLAQQRAVAAAATQLTGAMNSYANEWSEQCRDILTTIVDSRGEVLAIRTQLVEDGLPKFEEKFRGLLNRQATNQVAAFNTSLNRAADDITSRVDTINTALAAIPYRPGTYIRLEPERSPDPTIREFRQQLKTITTNIVGQSDDAYNEQRFLQVRDLLDRFVGREGSANTDQAWAKKVTDVRNWFTFGASERTTKDDQPVEHYTGSGGKSGGQKEKLAYTILAASLAYQYGLADGRDDSFRFVMIDEAFGKSTDESAKFGLSLFTRLGLQMLVVTPLQKIRTIAPYVSSVGYVYSGGDRSKMLEMTIEEFKERQRTHAGGGPEVL